MIFNNQWRIAAHSKQLSTDNGKTYSSLRKFYAKMIAELEKFRANSSSNTGWLTPKIGCFTFLYRCEPFVRLSNLPLPSNYFLFIFLQRKCNAGVTKLNRFIGFCFEIEVNFLIYKTIVIFIPSHDNFFSKKYTTIKQNCFKLHRFCFN